MEKKHQKPVIAMALAAIAFTGNPANAATTITSAQIDSALRPGNSGGTNRGPSFTYTTLIDGISTVITFSTNTGDVFLGFSSGGVIGIVGGSGAIAGIESRFSEVLTITLTPTSATGVSYTVNSGVILGANPNSNTTPPTFSFTDPTGSVTYASAALGSAESSGTLAFASAPSGIDSVSFALRQTVQTTNTTEGGFLSAFTVTAIPEPSAALLGGLGSLLLLRRRRA